MLRRELGDGTRVMLTGRGARIQTLDMAVPFAEIFTASTA